MNQHGNVLIYFISFSIGTITVGILAAQGLKERKKEWAWFLLFFLSYSLTILSGLLDNYYQVLPWSKADTVLRFSSLLSSVGIHSMMIFAPLYSHGLTEHPRGKRRNRFFLFLSLGLFLVPWILIFVEALSLEGLGFLFIGPVLLYSFVHCLKRFPYEQSKSVRRTFRLWLLFLGAVLLTFLYEWLMGQLSFRSSSEAGLHFLFHRDKTLYHGVFILFGILYFINALGSFINGESSKGRMEEGEFPSSLTEREREVLQLVLKGKSNSEIGETLFISVATVKAHLTKIFQKTTTKSRNQLMALFREYSSLERN